MKVKLIERMRVPLQPLLVVVVVLSLLAVGAYPQKRESKNYNKEPNLEKKQSRSRRPVKMVKDPEALALFLQLLERYANSGLGKSEIDQRLDRALNTQPKSREVASRIVSNFRKLSSSERSTLLGKFADITPDTGFSPKTYQTAFERLAASYKSNQNQDSEPDEIKRRPGSNMTQKHSELENPNYRENDLKDRKSPKRNQDERKPPDRTIKRKPISLSEESKYGLHQPEFINAIHTTTSAWHPYQESPRYTLWYEGLRCRSETDEDHLSWSDEIYVITTVTDASGNNSTTRHPLPYEHDWYINLDDGDTRTGPRRACWGGRDGRQAQDLTLTVSLFEQDSGNPEDTEDAMKLIWSAAGAICGATVHNTVVPCVIAFAVALVVELAVDIFTGGDDDLVEIKTRTITADQLRRWDQRDPRQRGDIFYHFSTVHQNYEDNAAGADYQVFFRVTSHLPFG
jgi:hypothetical protein